MKKWNLIIDVAECTNCNLCTLATQDEYVGNQWPGVAAEMPKHGHRWIDIKVKERGAPPLVDVAYLPVMCQHCDDAPCIKAAENDAVTKRDDGIVIIDPEKSVGQRQIMEACPYGVVFWNEEKNIPQANNSMAATPQTCQSPRWMSTSGTCLFASNQATPQTVAPNAAVLISAHTSLPARAWWLVTGREWRNS